MFITNPLAFTPTIMPVASTGVLSGSAFTASRFSQTTVSEVAKRALLSLGKSFMLYFPSLASLKVV